MGIWGMGGAGKTTLAKAILQELKAQFEALSFIENVKEQLARISLDELQKNCLRELLKDEDISIYDIKSTFMKNRLQNKKILLILDNVDNSIVAADLTKVLDWFGEGSRIIITSRDMQVLKNASVAFSTYHVPDLDFEDAFHLFNLKAFKQNEPSKGDMELSKSVVKYCHGNPLALVVLGCFLYG
ncbi:protein DA1-related 4-like [Neltuma alba]|uniref:protein DA1-related 4-like n=1 Tax=Neltuma alba TaxID=207710 RepID=UPI0010A2B9A6|nr:protein DA1-related 4-like [Prosopis alba]